MLDGANTFRLDYVGADTGTAFDAWLERFGRSWIAADFLSLEANHRIGAKVSGSRHAFATICDVEATPSHIRSRGGVSGDPVPYVYIVITSSAPVQIQFGERCADLAIGQMAIVGCEDKARVSLLAGGKRTSIRIPQRLLADTTRDLEDCYGHPLGASRGMMRLLNHQLSLARRLGPSLDAAANHVLAQHILDLATLCIGANRDATALAARGGLAAARLDAIRADLLSDLNPTHCRIEDVASRHGVSTRYVQVLFERAGTSFTHFVRDERLRAAHKALRDPRNRGRKVSDIAFSVGFSDVSYFNRAFKSRFGATPREIREG